jgi:hypothetical protein
VIGVRPTLALLCTLCPNRLAYGDQSRMLFAGANAIRPRRTLRPFETRTDTQPALLGPLGVYSRFGRPSALRRSSGSNLISSFVVVLLLQAVHRQYKRVGPKRAAASIIEQLRRFLRVARGRSLAIGDVPAAFAFLAQLAMEGLLVAPLAGATSISTEDSLRYRLAVLKHANVWVARIWTIYRRRSSGIKHDTLSKSPSRRQKRHRSNKHKGLHSNFPFVSFWAASSRVFFVSTRIKKHAGQSFFCEMV